MTCPISTRRSFFRSMVFGAAAFPILGRGNDSRPPGDSFPRGSFAAPNLLGVFAGHTHRQSLDCANGLPQLVVGANAAGA